jgi:septal ring factor EnvC (AmiA/AmiB activator)
MEESSYLSLPGTSWTLVSAEDRATLAQVARSIAALDGDPSTISPEDLALALSGVSSRILATVAGDERDLREMIAALRTCLAVTWDMYDKIQADRTSVTQHIENLKEQIQGLEAELTALRIEGEAPPRA